MTAEVFCGRSVLSPFWEGRQVRVPGCKQQRTTPVKYSPKGIFWKDVGWLIDSQGKAHHWGRNPEGRKAEPPGGTGEDRSANIMASTPPWGWLLGS